MNCAVQIYMVLGGLHVYKSVFLGWVVGRINIAVNGEHNCGVLPYIHITQLARTAKKFLRILHHYHVTDQDITTHTHPSSSF